MLMVDRSQIEQKGKREASNLTTAHGGTVTLRCSVKSTVLNVDLSKRFQDRTPTYDPTAACGYINLFGSSIRISHPTPAILFVSRSLIDLTP
jgi:hypothetical protein